MTYSIKALLDTPEIALTKWSVFEVPLTGEDHPWTRHLVGYSKAHSAGQATAALVAFDPIRRVGLTQSGRLYQLEGPPGHNLPSSLVWSRWKLLSGVAKEKEVTNEVLELMVTLPEGAAAAA